MAAKILEAKAIISAEDRTGKVFDAIEKRAKRLDAMFKGFARMNGERVGVGSSRFGRSDPFATMAATTKTLSRSMDQLNRSIQSLTRSSASRGGLGRGNGSGHTGLSIPGAHVLGLGGGFAVAAVVHEAAKASSERVHEQVRMRNSGMSTDEVRRATLDAADLSASNPGVGQNEMMHMLRNTRAVVGSYGEARDMMGDLAKLRVIAQTARPGQDVSEDFDQLVKGLEIKGVTQDPKKFHDYMQGIAKGLNTFGDTLRPSQYYDMFKYGRQATPGLSEDFILSTAPTLAQELGGSSYGTAVSGFNRAIVAGRMQKDSMEEMARIGLVGRGDIDKKGKLKPGRSMAGWEMAQSNPNEWVKQYLLPAMQAHNITDQAGILKEVGELFSNRMAAQMVGLLATQQSRIDKDRALVHGSSGLEAADYTMRHDPEMAAHALKEAVVSLGGTIGADVARQMAPYMADLAVSLNRLNASFQHSFDFATSHPDEASAQQKTFNAKMNRLLYGSDDNSKSVMDMTDEDKIEGEYQRQRRGLLDPSGRQPIIHKDRGAVPKGFEKSFAALDHQKDIDESGSYDPAPEVAKLDALDQARRRARADLIAFRTNVRRMVGGLSGAYHDGLTSPFVAEDPSDVPLATGWGPPRRSINYGNIDPSTGAAKVYGPPMPPPPPERAPPSQMDLGAILNGKVQAQLEGTMTFGGTIDVKVPQGWEARLTRLEAKSSNPQIRSNVGTSRPDTEAPGGR